MDTGEMMDRIVRASEILAGSSGDAVWTTSRGADFADGVYVVTHTLSVVLTDGSGERIPRSDLSAFIRVSGREVVTYTHLVQMLHLKAMQTLAEVQHAAAKLTEGAE